MTAANIQALRTRLIDSLSRPLGRETGFVPDLGMAASEPPRDAAVLIPIVTREHPQVLLTLRPDHLPRHPGQIAFPGGRVEPGEEPRAAALREAHEEIGLAETLVEVVGRLSPFVTGTGYRIAPYVGLVDEAYSLTLDPREVVEAFEVPFDFLMDPIHHVRRSAEFRGRTRTFYEMIFERHRIWGVTAGIVVELHRALYGTP